MTERRRTNELTALAPDVVLQTIGGEAILLKLTDETVFTLNDTGARVAAEIARGSSVQAIVRSLSEAYGADIGEIDRDVRALLHTLMTRGLVVLLKRNSRA